MNRRQRETLRRRFRPARIRLLFVGEAPPASGRFFYRGDSGLYRAMRDAFRLADPGIADVSFLDVFQAAGCYLLDLCPEPVDHLDSRSRRAACRANEVPLARAIAQLQPPMIATVVRSIDGNVTQSASCACWSGSFIHLPYPGRWSHHRDAFIATIVPKIKALLQIDSKDSASL
ncbi:MAG: hypothetical protein EXQ52_05645 [Bryobacterales bacterium]|nr:hypothetical protein [Bryobacterales bacterium]